MVCSLIYFISIAFKLPYNRNKLFKTLHYWCRDMLNLDFSDKGLWIVSPAYFLYDFSTKMLLMLYSINWPISLPGCLYFLRYWAICVLRYFVNQVVRSWILKKRAIFSTWPKSHDKNFNILRTKRAFKVKKKAFFIIF